MKRTLVERVAISLFKSTYSYPWRCCYSKEGWKRKARRIIAMVRRHGEKLSQGESP